MASPTHAMARTLGGGGDHGLLIQMAVVSAMSDQNDHLPAGRRGRVLRTYAPDGSDEQGALHHQRTGNRIPQPEADLRTSRP